jgi:hypothetical protein
MAPAAWGTSITGVQQLPFLEVPAIFKNRSVGRAKIKMGNNFSDIVGDNNKLLTT